MTRRYGSTQSLLLQGVVCGPGREVVLALVSEPGKLGLGSDGVCKSFFNDNSKMGKPKSSVDISHSETLVSSTFHFAKAIHAFKFMILGIS